MRWLSDRSNSAREEMATTSLSASVGLGMRHPSAEWRPWLWRRTANAAPPAGPRGASLTPCLGPARAVAELGEHRAHLFDRPVDFRARDHQRRSEAHDSAVGILGNQPPREQAIDDAARVDASGVDLEPDKEPLAADFPDQRTVDRLQPGEQMLAQLRGALDEVFVAEHCQRLERDAGGQRVAAERAAVV